MKTQRYMEQMIPPDLLKQVEALAAAEHRPASEMLREAVEAYLH